MPEGAPAAAQGSIGEAFKLGIVAPARAAFTDAMHVGSWVSAGFSVAAALLALAVLRPAAPVAAAESTAESAAEKV
jgi:hypothetical protein